MRVAFLNNLSFFLHLLTQSPGFSALVGQHAGKTWLSEGLEKSTANESLNKVKS